MKSLVNRVLIALVVLAMSSVMALAAGKSEKVNFTRDVVVNGTMVKKGTYTVKYDEKSGEMLVQQGNKTIAKTTAHLQNRAGKVLHTEMIVTNRDNNSVLRSLALEGDNQTMIVEEEVNQAVAPQ